MRAWTTSPADSGVRDGPLGPDSPVPDRFPIPEAGCPSGFNVCGGECIDHRSNAGHCGACGNACAAGQDCVASHCTCVAAGRCSGCCNQDTCVLPASQGPAACGKGGQSCKTCDDGRSCTNDQCQQGSCTSVLLMLGTCLIGSACYGEGTKNPANTCEQCSSSTSPTGWTHIPGCATSSTVAGGKGAGAVDGPLASASFYAPAGIAVDASGAVFVADRANAKIRKIASGQVTTIAGSGTVGFADGATGQAQFRSPEAVAVGTTGEIIVADCGNHRLRVIASGMVSTLAGSDAAGFKDGAAAQAQFNCPSGVTVSASGVVHVADITDHRIRSVTGGQVTTLAGTGTQGFMDGPAGAAQFSSPAGVAWVKPDVIYVSEQGHPRIRRVAGGQVTTVAGTGTHGLLDGPASTALFEAPNGMAVDGAGAVYIADSGNYRIRLLSTAGVVSTLAGSTPGFVDGPLASVKFGDPRGVALAPDGSLYVADMTNNAIRHITW